MKPNPDKAMYVFALFNNESLLYMVKILLTPKSKMGFLWRGRALYKKLKKFA